MSESSNEPVPAIKNQRELEKKKLKKWEQKEKWKEQINEKGKMKWKTYDR